MRVARLCRGIAIRGGESLVGRLGPRVSGIEREVHPGQTHARIERAERERAGSGRGCRLPRARLHIHQIVRAGREDVRPRRVDRERGLVDCVLRVLIHRARDANERTHCLSFGARETKKHKSGYCQKSRKRSTHAENGHLNPPYPRTAVRRTPRKFRPPKRVSAITISRPPPRDPGAGKWADPLQGKGMPRTSHVVGP